MNLHFPRTLSVGRYVLTPSSRPTSCGQYAASVSIRSGQGTSTHDTVMRFKPLFLTSAAAWAYALAQGLEHLHPGAATPAPLSISSL
ncbi:hypothetical protein [Brachymonas sp.]|uniref:hypothetical protein n=1 Tax=unclassified Brachymonas TaxID=2621329 RepID=UPI0035AF2EB6